MIEHVKSIAKRYDAYMIEEAIDLQIKNGTNPIFTEGTNEDVVSILAKAKFIRDQLDQGIKIRDALRELGRRTRMVVGGSND